MTSRRRLMEKVRVVQITLSTTKQDIFTTKTKTIPAGKMRFIVGMFLYGDGSTSATVDIEKKEKDGSYTALFKKVPVSPAGRVPVPERWNFDLENPIITLEYGTDLAATASAGAPEMTIIYYDD